jgi:hypothetical protein
MKANIANNDIEELHKEGMQYARCASLEIQIMINAFMRMSFAIKNALLKLPAQKSFGKRLFRYKSCTLILKPALFDTQMFVNP